MATAKKSSPVEHIAVDVNNSTDSYDDDLLHRAVSDAGRWAYGTIIVTVWVLNDDKTKLFRPNGGWWIDPVTHQHSSENCTYCRLSDPNYPGYIEPTPLPPGVGIPGVLWADSLRQHKLRKASPDASEIVWRDLESLAKDPDTLTDPRLEIVLKEGLGWAAGVAFNVRGVKGLVIFMARATVNRKKLTSKSNEAYLNSAAELIGAAYALRRPRHVATEERQRELDATIRRVRAKLLAVARLSGGLKPHVNQNSEHGHFSVFETIESMTIESTKTKMTSTTSIMKRRLLSWMKKNKGSGKRPPPGFTVEQSIWTFVGTLSTLLILTRLNLALKEAYGADYSIVLGPFGALMTLQYGLTAAPASQPPNVLLGQAVSMSIALGISNIEAATWIRQSLATAISVSIMVKVGITHPPAGAAALLFADGSQGWGNMAVGMLANSIALMTATMINNLNERRQYPTYWGIWYPITRFKDVIRKKQAEN